MKRTEAPGHTPKESVLFTERPWATCEQPQAANHNPEALLLFHGAYLLTTTQEGAFLPPLQMKILKTKHMVETYCSLGRGNVT